MRKEDFVHIIGLTLLKTMTKDFIKSTFHVTGVYPFCCDILSEETMAPSRTMSMTSGLLKEIMNSPTQRIVEEMCLYRINCGHCMPLSDMRSFHTPNLTPVHRHFHDTEAPPNLSPHGQKRKEQDAANPNDNLSKRCHALAGSLKESVTASYLLKEELTDILNPPAPIISKVQQLDSLDIKEHTSYLSEQLVSKTELLDMLDSKNKELEHAYAVAY